MQRVNHLMNESDKFAGEIKRAFNKSKNSHSMNSLTSIISTQVKRL